MQLRRVGVTKISELKGNCREFEQYMEVNYDYEIVKRERSLYRLSRRDG